jgi:hypothetical protein
MMASWPGLVPAIFVYRPDNQSIDGDGSHFAIHPTAGMIGETDALSSRTHLRCAAEGGREAILDENDSLAMLAAKR